MDDYKEYDKWLDSLTYDELIKEEKVLIEKHEKVISIYKNEKNYYNAKRWRLVLTNLIKVGNKIENCKKVDYTPENIYKMAKRIGVKPTA